MVFVTSSSRTRRRSCALRGPSPAWTENAETASASRTKDVLSLGSVIRFSTTLGTERLRRGTAASGAGGKRPEEAAVRARRSAARCDQGWRATPRRRALRRGRSGCPPRRVTGAARVNAADPAAVKIEESTAQPFAGSEHHAAYALAHPPCTPLAANAPACVTPACSTLFVASGQCQCASAGVWNRSCGLETDRAENVCGDQGRAGRCLQQVTSFHAAAARTGTRKGA